MRFYQGEHTYYCGVDLHAKTMYLCIVDQQGEVCFSKNLATSPGTFLEAVAPYRENLVVAVECMFCWYWLADLCEAEGIEFVLGHALYMKAIHGGKVKNDKVDAKKIALLTRAGMLPQAYVYPKEHRATRDLLRRRMQLMRERAELLAHIQNTKSQYNLPNFGKALAYKRNRSGVVQHFSAEGRSVCLAIELDLKRIDLYDDLLREVELYITRYAKAHHPQAYYRLRSVPGIGEILALVILFEINDINRFPKVGNLLSYARLVKPSKESAGKRVGYSGSKIGNAYLKWAFSEASVLFLSKNPDAQAYFKTIEARHGKPKALSVLAQRLGRAVYHLLKYDKAFDRQQFLKGSPAHSISA